MKFRHGGGQGRYTAQNQARKLHDSWTQARKGLKAEATSLSNGRKHQNSGFEATLVYIVNSKAARATQTQSQNKKLPSNIQAVVRTEGIQLAYSVASSFATSPEVTLQPQS